MKVKIRDYYMLWTSTRIDWQVTTMKTRLSEGPPKRSRLEQESMAREWCMWTSVNEDKGEERAEDDKNERTEKYTEEL